VTGEVTPRGARALLAGSAAAFVGAAALISPLCGALALPVLAILLGYSYAKRFTWACHLWLGVAQALAPIGVAIALTGTAPAASIVLGLGVGAWIAGFDVFYALQDAEFDRGEGLHSIPARFGVAGSLWWARALHLLAVAGVVAAGPLAGRGPAWLAGSAVLAAVVAAEHLYVAPRGVLRPERINVAFFNYNAFASVAFALCALADLALAR
jgi:4-hydroxybenzoate polyprenyltransferase